MGKSWRMAHFIVTRVVADNRMVVVLNPDFTIDHWQALEDFYQKEIAEGKLLWDLDLGQLSFINSMMLGLIVGFNTMLNSRGGEFRLLVPEHSRIGDLLTLAKLDTIINVIRYTDGVGSIAAGKTVEN